jgi:pantoate--beta-alanine ligase
MAGPQPVLGLASHSGHAVAVRIVKSVAAMQRAARRWRQQGAKIGLVPTMGCLHEGHLSLVREARRRVGPKGAVVVSIYVNPTQFGPKEDLAKYPRDFAHDCRRCRKAGADVVFAPSDGSMYPDREAGRYSTYVTEERLSRRMEGKARPTHFRGVTTIVAKLFNCVLPDVAVFGAKDWQQAAVVGRMVCDLNFPLKLVVAPTQREPDGLAMSSRNQYLSAAEREQATVLWCAINLAQWTVRHSKRPVSAAKLTEDLRTLIGTQQTARLDYLEFFDGRTLEPLERVSRGTHLALAVFIGRTRLIDNAKL